MSDFRDSVRAALEAANLPGGAPQVVAERGESALVRLSAPATAHDDEGRAKADKAASEYRTAVVAALEAAGYSLAEVEGGRKPVFRVTTRA